MMRATTRMWVVTSIGGVLLAAVMFFGTQTQAQEPRGPVVHGQYLVLPPGDPAESQAPPVFDDSGTDDGVEIQALTGLPALRAAAGPRFAAPDSLGTDLPLMGAGGYVVGDFFEIRFAYGEPGRLIEVTRWTLPSNDSQVRVVVSEQHPFKQTELTEFDGIPALLSQPRETAPASNPREIRWIERGIETIVTSYGFETTAELLDFARTIRAAR